MDTRKVSKLSTSTVANRSQCTQVGLGLYVYEIREEGQWSLLKDLIKGRVSKAQKSKPIFSKRYNISLANFNNQFIFALGGFLVYKTYADVYRYDIGSDQWDILPAINLSRHSQSSCVLGSSLYVCGGIKEDCRSASTIERLFITDARTGETSNEWEILEISHRIGLCLMVPVSLNEILLLKSIENSVVINVDQMTKEQY